MGEAHISRQVQARPIRVMLVDDHEVVRRGLRSLLEPAADILICGETGGVSEAVEAVQSMDPDVVIMDVGLPDGSGIDAARQIRVRLPSTRVVIFTSFADPEALFASILAGASGFLLKQIEGGSLVSAIRMVAQGRRVLDPSIMEAALDRLRQYLVEDEKLARLSFREERILSLVAEGKTNEEIAEAVHLAAKTVKNYLSAIFSKLDVSRRVEAAAYFSRRGARVPSSSQR